MQRDRVGSMIVLRCRRDMLWGKGVMWCESDMQWIVYGVEVVLLEMTRLTECVYPRIASQWIPDHSF